MAVIRPVEDISVEEEILALWCDEAEEFRPKIMLLEAHKSLKQGG
jgi:hypothetical protein